MNKIISAVVLAVLAGNACADNWTYVDRDEDTALWVQKDTIWRSGSNVKMWSMYDHRIPSPSLNSPPLPTTFRSSVGLFEYDCNDRRSRMLQATAYEDAKGKGRIAFTMDQPETWKYVKPGSSDETRWKFACKKS